MADGTRIYFFKSSQIRNVSHSGFGSLWQPTESRELKQMATDSSANVFIRDMSHTVAILYETIGYNPRLPSYAARNMNPR